MVVFVIIAIALAASLIGAICGVGGGVVIKPVLDAVGLFSVSQISLLSSCTVLSMSMYSVIRIFMGGRSAIDLRTSLPLGIGAAVGGSVGQSLFRMLLAHVSRPNIVGAVQALLLLFMCLALIPYTIKKEGIRTYHVQNPLSCAFIGLVLGMFSAFLGIGGGPINLAVLSVAFSMDVKMAASNSLFVILLSQAAGLIKTVVSGALPAVEPLYLILMVVCGLCGGITGRAINKRIAGKTVEKLFILLLGVISILCLVNFVKYLSA